MTGKMKISKQQLIELGACEDDLDRFIMQTNNSDEVASLIGGENMVSDLLWLAGKTLLAKKLVRFACDCALVNVELIKPYTADFDLIIGFLNDPSDTKACIVREASQSAIAAMRAQDAPANCIYAARMIFSAANASNVDIEKLLQTLFEAN